MNKMLFLGDEFSVGLRGEAPRGEMQSAKSDLRIAAQLGQGARVELPCVAFFLPRNMGTHCGIFKGKQLVPEKSP